MFCVGETSQVIQSGMAYLFPKHAFFMISFGKIRYMGVPTVEKELVQNSTKLSVCSMEMRNVELTCLNL